MKQNSELRRFKDIVAFKNNGQQAIAFHSTNLEVAEISEELWSSLEETTYQEAVHKDNLKNELFRPDLENWNQEISTTTRTQNLKFKIKTLTLNVTQICNLHCHYCVAGGDGTYGDPVRQIAIEKTLPQIKFFLEQLSGGEQFHLIFLGGEPLLYPEAIRAIATYTQELGISKEVKTSFHIITNGTLINQKFVDLMLGLKPSITFSMDGDPETNDQARPQKNGEGSSKQALAGLAVLLKNRDQFSEITIHSVFNKKNMNVVNAYLFFKDQPVEHFEMTYDITEKDESANQAFISQMKEVARIAYEHGGEAELRRIALYDGYFNALDEQIKKTSHCGSGKTLLSLNSRNQIFSCPLEISHKSEQVGDQTDLNYDKLEVLQKPIIELNNCGKCWARHLCGGGCMYSHKATTGNAHEKHPTYCERTRSLIIDAIMYYKTTRDEGVQHGQNHSH